MSFFKPKNSVTNVRIIPARSSDQTRVEETGPSVPAGMWEKCLGCGEIVYADDLQENIGVCPMCGYHFRLQARQRILIMADIDSFEEFGQNIKGTNPLDFPGYDEKLKTARAFTGQTDAVITGMATIKGNPCVLCAMDSMFMMGSMGAAVGEKMTVAVEVAMQERLPLVVFTTSGGARMQEGMVSLMQMAKVSSAVGRLHEQGLLYLVILTDPTTGGVTASFAMLGDITLAEPQATIGFAGRRVIEQTMRQTLPDSFQTAEFLLEKGFVDHIVPRTSMANMIGNILKFHEGNGYYGDR